MIYQIRRTTQFKKDAKRVLKQGKDIEQLLHVVQELSEGHSFEAVYCDHPMKA